MHSSQFYLKALYEEKTALTIFLYILFISYPQLNNNKSQYSLKIREIFVINYCKVAFYELLVWGMEQMSFVFYSARPISVTTIFFRR